MMMMNTINTVAIYAHGSGPVQDTPEVVFPLIGDDDDDYDDNEHNQHCCNIYVPGSGLVLPLIVIKLIISMLMTVMITIIVL